MTRASSLAPFALLAVSCAGAPPVEHPPPDFAVPGTWAAGALAAPPEGEAWWTRFGDPRLDALVVEALERNHELEAAAARVLAVAAQATIAGAGVFPAVAANAGASRTRRNFIGFPIPGGGDVLTTRTTIFGVSLDASWELDLWGRIRAGRSAALADLEAAAADAHAARLSLTGLTARLWFGVVEASRQLELAEATRESFEATHERIASRYERGLRPSLDVRLSLSNIAAAEAGAARRRADVDRLVRQLEALAGRYPAALLELPADLPPVPPPVPAGIPSAVLELRPDIAAAERRLAAAGARVKEARRALFPRISLTASGGTQSDDLEELVDLDLSVWTLAGNLAQPVFQGGRLLAGVDLAEAQQREAVAAYLDTVLQAFREVETALAEADLLRAEEEALRTAVEQSVAARELAEDRYDRGLDDIITVLEAQRRAFEAESALILAQRRRLESRIDLHLALGGDYRSLRAGEHGFEDAEPGDASAPGDLPAPRPVPENAAP